MPVSIGVSVCLHHGIVIGTNNVVLIMFCRKLQSCEDLSGTFITVDQQQHKRSSPADCQQHNSSSSSLDHHQRHRIASSTKERQSGSLERHHRSRVDPSADIEWSQFGSSSMERLHRHRIGNAGDQQHLSSLEQLHRHRTGNTGDQQHPGSSSLERLHRHRTGHNSSMDMQQMQQMRSSTRRHQSSGSGSLERLRGSRTGNGGADRQQGAIVRPSCPVAGIESRHSSKHGKESPKKQKQAGGGDGDLCQWIRRTYQIDQQIGCPEPGNRPTVLSSAAPYPLPVSHLRWTSSS
ncbi:hypothetical protein ACOMHN_009885 [Nucella lapillus]